MESGIQTPRTGKKVAVRHLLLHRGDQPAFPFQLPLEGKEEDPPGSSRAVRNTG